MTLDDTGSSFQCRRDWGANAGVEHLQMVMAGWPDMLEELVNNSVIVDGHRTLMSAVMQGDRSVRSGLNDVVQGLLTGFEVTE